MRLRYPLLLTSALGLMASLVWFGDDGRPPLRAGVEAVAPVPVVAPERTSFTESAVNEHIPERPVAVEATIAPVGSTSVHAAGLNALSEAQRLLALPEITAEVEQRLAGLKDQILVIASNDESLRAQLIQWLQSDPGGQQGKFALSILEQLNRPDVLQAGLNLVRSQDRAAVLTGLDIVGQQGGGTQQAFEVAEPLLHTFTEDAEVLQAALQAVETVQPDTAKVGPLLNTLATLSRHWDSGVRSASLFGLAQNARGAQDLRTVIEAMDRSDPDDRISAAMALEKSRDVSDSLRDAFITHMSNRDEIWEVRRMSADALERFQLNDQSKDLLVRFREEQQAVVNDTSTNDG